jgi:NAD(P)-dependent dehydrogenase (short-subunit alcohol dehydrogenase family)
VSLLEAEGAEVRGLDLASGFDVSDRGAWEAVEPADLVCLNAGVLARGDGSFEDYRRIVGVNVDGVVFGIQALAPRMEPGSAFVVTASLAGLIPMESDPLYVLTKHAVVGYARSMAPLLEPHGIRVNLVCPGIVRTPMTEDAQADLDAAGFPLLEPEQIAEAILLAGRSEENGQAWVCQPGREPTLFRFPGVPGPRVPGAEGMVPQL